MFQYIKDSQVTPGDPFIEAIHNKVMKLQENKEVAAVMTLDEHYRIMINRAKEEGLQEGHQNGIQEGRMESTLESVGSLMKNLGLSLDEAMDALGIPEKEQQKYRRLVAVN